MAIHESGNTQSSVTYIKTNNNKEDSRNFGKLYRNARENETSKTEIYKYKNGDVEKQKEVVYIDWAEGDIVGADIYDTDYGQQFGLTLDCDGQRAAFNLRFPSIDSYNLINVLCTCAEKKILRIVLSGSVNEKGYRTLYINNPNEKNEKGYPGKIDWKFQIAEVPKVERSKITKQLNWDASAEFWMDKLDTIVKPWIDAMDIQRQADEQTTVQDDEEVIF